MDDHWYYAEASDRSYGPMSIEELGRALREKANSVEFLVWCPGMSDWAKAKDQSVLQKFFQPPALPNRLRPAVAVSKSDRDRSELALASVSFELHPWRRYFARMLDLYLFVLIFFIFLGIIFPRLFASNDKSLDALYGILGTAAYAVFEGFCLNVFGTSLGKRLYGIKIRRSRDDGFTLATSLKRSFAVWVRGLGLGIPIVALFTLITAYRTLTQERQTSWDRDFRFVISHSKLSTLRWIGIVAVWLLMLAFYSFLIALGAKS